jgi:hypothetical protein
MVLLGDDTQVEARYGSIGDAAIVEARYGSIGDDPRGRGSSGSLFQCVCR